MLERIHGLTAATRLTPVGRAGWYVVDSKSHTAAELIAILQADPDVAQVAGDVIGYAPGVRLKEKSELRPMFTDVIPNDPGFANEWGLLNTGQTVNGVTGIAGADIDVEGAWSRSFPVVHDTFGNNPGGSRVYIAVVDSGIDYARSDLAPNVWAAPSAYTISIQGNVYNCPAGSHGFSAVDYESGCSGQESEAESIGHGTQVASIIGAAGNNGQGMTGEAWATGMVSIRVFDENGMTSETTVQTGIDALLQIMNHFGSAAPVRVINMSVTFPGPTPGLESSIQEAAAYGIVTAVATGNECQAAADYPAYYRTTGEIAVAGSDQLDEPAFFAPGNCSNGGGQVAAPGKNIEAIGPGSDQNFSPSFGGTSASAPFVAAAAAMLMSQCPLTPNAVVNTLAGTAALVTNLQSVSDSGQRLDLGKALDSCLDTSAGGGSTITVNLDPGQGIYDTYGEVSATVDGTTYTYSYDTFNDDTDSIGSGLADAITSSYVTAEYQGNGLITLTANAKGAFTNYSMSVGVTHSCDGPARECDPAPTVRSGGNFTGGTGPTR